TPPEAPAPKIEAVSLASVGLDGDALDRKTDPCQDFYQFACGGWIEKTEIPSDRPRWVRSFSEIHKRNEADLKDILDQAWKAPGDDPVKQRLGKFYGACMDEAAVEKAGTKPLKALMDKVAKVKNAATLSQVVTELHRHKIWALFDLEAVQDFKDATSMIAFIDQNGLGLPDRDYYLSEDKDKAEIRAAYQTHVADMFKLYGMKAAAATAAAKDVLRIETALAKVSKTRVERRDPVGLYNKIDREGVKAAAPGFTWDAYFAALGHPDITAINVTAPKFLEGMNTLIGNEKPAAWKNYLSWQILHAAAETLPKAFVDENFKLTQRLTGQKAQRDRWKRCVEATDHALGELLAQAFVELRFGGDSKAAAESYVQQISEAFDRGLDGLSWMDDTTRARAREKLKAFAYLIGYPGKWKNYDFEVGDAYAANMAAAAAWELNDQLDKIGKPVDRGEWEMTPPTVNAYYHPLKNQMVFPAGILQPPFYSVSAAVPVNLGAMGMVVGHELTHGFDDQGSQFDKDGNLNNWWTDEVQPRFKEQTQCVADQYEAYEPVPGSHLNGKLTLGENIADMGGVKLAFNAYRAMRAKADVAKVADGFTEDQQFFLANAQIWCAKMTDEYARLMVQNDPHSHPRFRVNGPLSNLPEFSEAFSCPAGSAMHPEKTCSVW
ncbi:MAG: M13 family metallopeptidase, partial [Myxococcales bacterium]|nr:M13 family metallopeptidase [Myxococcales bacterium]